MRTFSIQTLGCKVNQYESEQVAAYLRSRGLRESADTEQAELRIINTCSVTVQAASQSRQSVRRATRLPVLSDVTLGRESLCGTAALGGVRPQAEILQQSTAEGGCAIQKPRVIVIGCWATSDKPAAAALEGVDTVLTHQDNLAAELDRLLSLWNPVACPPTSHADDEAARRLMDAENKEESITAADKLRLAPNKPIRPRIVNEIPGRSGPRSQREGEAPPERRMLNELRLKWEGEAPVEPKFFRNARLSRSLALPGTSPGPTSLPLLGEHQSGRQRAFLKIQDGCDAHCTYCIIPKLRPALWSKPIEDAVEEARRLVASGHREIVLTGIFLGAYGHPTALRRRQESQNTPAPLASLIEALCTRVPGLLRLRLSSLEPGDLDDRLLSSLKSYPQIVPHFHLPLQSGSEQLLRRMNRQYRRDDFLRLLDRISTIFDRPALTTDIIVGFPGESDEQFQHTLDVVHAARFIHIHAFPYSPRPGTAAARWKQDVAGTIVNQRIRQLTMLAKQFDVEFRQQFVGDEVSMIVERGTYSDGDRIFRRGRCERYFAIDVEDPDAKPGDLLRVRIDRITDDRTFGTRSAARVLA